MYYEVGGINFIEVVDVNDSINKVVLDMEFLWGFSKRVICTIFLFYFLLSLLYFIILRVQFTWVSKKVKEVRDWVVQVVWTKG